MIITKRKEGTGLSNVQTIVRGVGKTQVWPFHSHHSPAGQLFSPQDCLSIRKLIKWIIYELPLDREASIYIKK